MTDTDAARRIPSTPSESAPTPPTGRGVSPATRLQRLERACAELWHHEPDVDAPHRSRLLRQLGEIERWVTSMTLRLAVDPDGERRVEQQITRYERRLDGLASAWATTGRLGLDTNPASR